MRAHDALERFALKAKLKFKDPSLLARAFVHSSYLNEDPAAGESNERLEFLGDAVLDLVLAEEVYRLAPGMDEGELTRRRNYVASRRFLADAARRLDMGGCLMMSRGDAKMGGRDREAALAGAFEAVIGAVFLDRGYRSAASAAMRLLGKELEQVARDGVPKDPKTRLQEYCFAHHLGLPLYRVVEETGPTHARAYQVAVDVAGETLGQGGGARLADAQQAAAKEALSRLEAEK